MSWFGFWIFAAVFVVCEAFLVMRGFNTVLWHFKTPPELELQKKLIEKAGR